MAFVVYFLCAVTAIVCACLLLRSYFRSRARLLLWSGLAFVCFALSNALLPVDMLIVKTDLSPYRHSLTLLGGMVLLFGLIWEDSR